MSHCPSEDWDRYNDQQEKVAMDQWIGEIHEMAERLFVASPALTPEQAYHRAFHFMLRRSDMDDAMRKPYSVKKIAPDDRNWAEEMVFRFEDLWP